MDKRIKENIRVKNQISVAYIDLLKQSSVEDAEMITISQITSKANVSRMAYYRNFTSKTNIIEYYLSESLWQEFQDALPVDCPFWSVEYGTVLFQHMRKHREEILVLRRHGYADLILSVFNSINEELIGDMPRNSIKRSSPYTA